jgi:ribosome-interacting GTPase 1
MPIQALAIFHIRRLNLSDLPPISKEYSESWLFNIIRIADLIMLIVDISESKPVDQISEINNILATYHIILAAEGEKRPQGAIAQKPTVLVWTKMDLFKEGEQKKILSQSNNFNFQQVFISIKSRTNIDELRSLIFKGLKIIRIYTKIPGKKIDFKSPYVLPEGTTVFNAALAIHKELAQNMTYARIWGSERYDGQRVEKNYILKDKDVIEIHNR